MGCVLQAGAGMNVARQAALKAGRAGGGARRDDQSGLRLRALQAVVHAVEAVKAGYVDLMLAGGTESMSNAPFLLKGARWGYRMGNAEVVDSMLQEGLTCAIERLPHGHDRGGGGAALRASRARTRTRSPPRASAAPAIAVKSGVFDREIVAVDVPQRKGPPLRVTKDEYPRAGTTAETLAALRPAFAKDGTVTAGNASGSTTAPRRWWSRRRRRPTSSGSKPLARILSYCTTGVDPKIMGMGPVPAMRKAVERAGLSLGDLDLVELNEAFAAQSLAVVRELGLDPGEGQRPRRRDRARPSDRRQRRARAHHAGARAAGARRRARRGVAVHRRRHGHRDGRRGGLNDGVGPPAGARASGSAGARLRRGAPRVLRVTRRTRP